MPQGEVNQYFIQFTQSIIVAPCTQYSCGEVDDKDKNVDLTLARTYQQQ